MEKTSKITMPRMTLEEIAKEINISRTTIYKVMKGKGNVSEETSSIVNAALEKYHYVQNKHARNLAMNKNYTIGYVGFQSRSAGYFSKEIKKGISRAVKEFGDDGLIVSVSEFDVEKPKEQEEAVDRMLAQGVRSFVLAYSHSETISRILKKLEEQNCSIVLLSRDFEENESSYYVGVDYNKSGRLAAEMMGKMLPLGGSVFIPVTEEYKTNKDILERLSGFCDKCKDFPQLRLLPVSYGLVEEEEISRALEKCIREEAELKGIFDLTYRLDVAAKTLKRLGRTDLTLIGFDLFEEIREDVESSVISGVVYQDLNMQAYKAVKLLFEEMCYGKKKTDRKQYAKLEIIMQENINYF